MTYFLGVDLGTTFTSAAVAEDGNVGVVDLEGRTATMPSVVFLAEDGTFLVGEPAIRRAVMEPARAAQQFKRRFGDTTPLFLGGSPMSADALTAELLRAVVALVAARHGGQPEHVAVTHPANWGGYKLELLEQAIRRAGLETAMTISEPEAAVLHYSQLERVPTGSLVAVFDLGGGTFDAAVIRKTDTGTEFLGQPEGIERLGGIDFDQAVFAFVAENLEGAIDSLDLEVESDRAALERLRADCVQAKEGLSADEVTSVAVALPNLHTTIRITRAEFEQLVRPSLTQAIDALHRALASAGIESSDLDAVLLAGGSSRIPLVAEMVGNELSRPVAVDSHPKHVVAMGAALAARDARVRAGGEAAPSPPAPQQPPPAPQQPPPAPQQPPPAPQQPPPAPQQPAPAPQQPPPAPQQPAPAPQQPAPQPQWTPAGPPTPAQQWTQQQASGPQYTGPPPTPPKRSKTWMVLLGLLVVAAAAVGGFFLLSGDDGETETATDPTTTTPAPTSSTPDATATTGTPVPTATSSAPAPAQPFTFGDDAALDQLWVDCDAGAWAACDALFATSGAGTDYESFGSTCASYVEPTNGTCAAGSPIGGGEYEINFAAGASSGEVTGIVVPGDDLVYFLGAAAGQQLEADLFTFPASGSFGFDLVDPSGNVIGDEVTGLVTLPANGDYEIRFVQLGGTEPQFFSLFVTII